MRLLLRLQGVNKMHKREEHVFSYDILGNITSRQIESLADRLAYGLVITDYYYEFIINEESEVHDA